MPTTDTAIGAILQIPPQALNDIKAAEDAIKSLGRTSNIVARSVNRDWGQTAITGLDAFITKVTEAQNRLNGVKMPTIDGGNIAQGISQIAQAIATVDKSATTGANRIGRIADSITKLNASQPSVAMFQAIANGITAIGNTSQQTIQNVSQLAQAMAQLARDIRTVQNAQQQQANNTATAAQYNKLYKEQADLVRQINEIKAKGANADARDLTLLDKMRARYDEINQQLDKLNRKKQTAASELAMVRGANRVGDVQARSTASGAINYAKLANSLQNLQAAYKNLKAVMATVDPKSTEWQRLNTVYQDTKKKIDDIKRAMGELQSQSKRTNDSLGKLKGLVAQVFSVSAIYGFIKNMVKVRGEFELQNVALRAILQNKDEADRIFLQVQQMAMQSPFSIMQLTTYTKQLAAYRIEADKLFGTTKMLADVSAGLGVDIQRLILAYGQVKSANYLRATEIRQFTEAGLNIAGELASYFSELQGRMVTVGEVMEMVTKRMVKFEDVEEVFKRVTSAGGIFYDMQKKQSESISGQLQRIGDAYSIMLNDIGKSNQGFITDTLSAIRDIIKHWRMLAPILKTIGGLMALVYAVKGAKAALLGLTKMTVALKNIKYWWTAAAEAAKTAKIAFATTGIGALIALGLTLISLFVGMREEANKLNEELSRIGDESAEDLKASISTFKMLADVISDTNKSYTERTDALTELRRVYSQILPQHKLEETYIQGLKGDYTELNKAISEYYQQQEYRKKYDTILASDDAEKIKETLAKTLQRASDEDNLGVVLSEAQIKAWADTIAKELSTGKIPNSIDGINQKVKSIFKDAKLDDYLRETYGKADFTDVIDQVDELNKKFGDIALATSGATDAMEGYKASLSQMDARGLDQTEKSLVEMREKIDREYRQNKQTATQLEWTNRYKTYAEYEKAYEEEHQKRLAQLEEQFDAVAEARSKMMAQDFIDETDRLTKSLTDEVAQLWETSIAMRDLEKRGQSGSKEYENLSKKFNALEQSAQKTAATFGTSVNTNFIKTADTSYELQGYLDELAVDAFPGVAREAIKNLDKVKLAILGSKKVMLEWLIALKDMLPDSLADKLPDFASSLKATDDAIAMLNGHVSENIKLNANASDARAKAFSETTKRNVDKYGASIARINALTKNSTQTASEMAKALRGNAKEWESTINSYETSTNKQVWLNTHAETAADIEQMKKDVKAARAIADELSGIEPKKAGGGTDVIAELWKKRLKALEDYYKQYENLRKDFSKGESERRAKFAFGDLFKTLGLDINAITAMGMDKKGLVANIDAMIAQVAKERPKLAAEFEKALADTKVKIDVEIQEESRRKLQSNLDNLFANYNLTKEFANLGMNIDLTYIVGGKPTTLTDIRAQLLELTADLNNQSEEQQKMLRKAMADLNKLELDNQKQRIKNLHKFTLEAVSDRMRIEMKAQEEINKIRNSQDMGQTAKDLAVDAVVKKKKEDLDKLAWDTFKSSDLYIDFFENIEYASKESIDFMIERIENLKDSLKSLPADQVRAIVKQLDDFKERSARLSNPFGLIANNIIPAIKAMTQMKRLAKDIAKAQTNVESAKKQRDAYQDLVVTLNEQLQLQLASGNATDDEIKQTKKQLHDAEMLLSLWKAITGQKERQVKSLKQQWSDAKSAKEKASIGLGTASAALGELSQALTTIKDDWQQIFGTQSDTFNDTFDTLSEITGALSNLTNGLERIIQGDLIGGVIGTITGVFSTIASFFAIGDKKKERKIKRLTEKVEDLDYAYQKLEKSIEAAYTFDDYNARYEQSIKNLEMQKKSYEEMARLEAAKKKTDKEKQKEYERAAEEAQEKMDELKKRRIEAMGSTTDYLSEAQSFVDVWLDAYREVGDGTDALKEHWDEFMDSLVVKQAAAALVSKRLEKVIGRINDAIDAGMVGTDLSSVIKNATAEWDAGSAQLNQVLKEFFDAMGVNLGKVGDFGLSDLQQGIQNITEPQAAAIEAYLNSMRFAVYRHTEQLDALIAAVSAQYGAGENPIVTELKGIRSVLDTIDRRFGSIVESRAGRGAYIRIGN